MLSKPKVSDFVCPQMHSPLVERQGCWRSDAIGQDYPLIDGVPFLFSNTKAALNALTGRAQVLLGGYHMVADKMKDDLSALRSDCLPATRQRLTLQRQHHIARTSFIERIIQPFLDKKNLAVKSESMYQDVEGALALVNNYPNILRDWGQPSGENEKHFDALRSILGQDPNYKKVLVLGAGACRLAFDFHQAGFSEEIFCCDINPLLLLSARLILDGNAIEVPYTTYVPKDVESIGGKATCRVPLAPKPGMHLVFADAYHLPFKDQQFDAVITPWFIDILPQPLEVLLQSVSRVLKTGGDWLNTGTLNMQLPVATQNYFFPELEQVAEAQGFKMLAVERAEVPYLISSASAHRRFELITSFRAQLNRPS